MTITAPRRSAQRVAAARPATRPWGGLVVFVSFALLYCAVGTVIYDAGFINPDASSRLANAGYTLMSRDPHLGAVGFVWQPLPSFLSIPLLVAGHSWPALQHSGFIAVFESSIFMAAAVLQVRGIALDRSVSTGTRWLAVTAFGLHPMVILYGSNGMSEAVWLCLILWACRRLLRWMNSGSIVDLLVCSVGLALAYLTRIESMVATVSAALFVVAITTVRHRYSGWKAAARVGLHDGVILLFPTFSTALTWAFTGWVLVGSPLDPITSQYGNTSQVAAAGIGLTRQALGLGGTAHSIAAQLFGMEPLVVVAVAAAITYAVRHRRADVGVPVALLGSIVVFQAVAIITASTYGWFRFFLPAVPLAVVSLLTVSNPLAVRDTTDSGRRPANPAWVGLMLVAVLVTSIPVAAKSMLTPAVGKEEYGLRSIIWPDRYPKSDHWLYWTTEMANATAQWFDNQHLPPGSVLVDTFALGETWLASENPRQFVVRSDFDFFDKLNAPLKTGVRYILVPKPSGLGDLDAINIRYPTMWQDGGGIASLTMKVANPQGYEQFRIYWVDGSG